MTDNLIISTGLKFKSTSFSDTAEVVTVSKDTADIRITNSEGHSRVLKGWDLAQVKARFESGEYTKLENGPNYSVW